MFCVSGKEISDKLHHAPSTRHWTSTYLETLMYTLTWSFDITFHQSPVYMIEHNVSELYCNPPMSTKYQLQVIKFKLLLILQLDHSSCILFENSSDTEFLFA